MELPDELSRDKLNRILTNVWVLTKLYSPRHADFRREYDEEITVNNKTNRTVVIDHNYVSIVRKTRDQINNSIQQLCGCEDITDDEVGRICQKLTQYSTLDTCGRFCLKEDQLIEEESGIIKMPFLLAIIDNCPFTNKARYNFHVSLFQIYGPNTDKVTVLKAALDCIICLDNQRDIILMPCHHLIMCHGCTGALKDFKCPMCKMSIQSIERVYM